MSDGKSWKMLLRTDGLDVDDILIRPLNVGTSADSKFEDDVDVGVVKLLSAVVAGVRLIRGDGFGSLNLEICGTALLSAVGDVCETVV